MPDIYISPNDLRSPRVDEVIAIETAAKKQYEGVLVEDVQRPFVYNPMFYYSVATALMAFCAWAAVEPFISEMDPNPDLIRGHLLFMGTAAMVGLALGAVYGIANRNPNQAAYCGVVGVGVGLLAGLVASVLANIIFTIGLRIVFSFVTMPIRTIRGVSPIPFLALMCTRSCAWAIVASSAGLPLGVSLKSKKVLSVGVIGGVVGGAVGGLFFDPVDLFLSFDPEEGWLSRMVGLTAVGLLVGLFTGYIENVARTAWVQMLRGPLTGKQFNLFKSPMIVGSSPRADIYLFKDPNISPEHASITATGSRFLISDLNSQSGVFVNGKRVSKAVLQKGDIVTLGETVLKYDDKQRRL